MKYVQFTYVDSRTGTPLTEGPAYNGPSIPEGVVPTFDIESSRTEKAPIVYGFIEEEEGEEENSTSSSLPDFIREIDEESFFNTFKYELKERARTRRKQVEHGGIEVGGQFIGTTIEDQNRIANMVTTLLNDEEMGSIDFEYSPTQWVTIPRAFALEVAKAAGRHVQACFSWCKGIHDQIDDMELSITTLDNALPILEAINSFGQQAPEEEEEELPEEEPTDDYEEDEEDETEFEE